MIVSVECCLQETLDRRLDKEEGSLPAKEMTSVSAGFTQLIAGSHMSRNVLSFEHVPHPAGVDR